ncbi:hypothetical protein HN873_057224, partial [Arachis hypogaea]
MHVDERLTRLTVTLDYWTENWHMCQAAVETVLRGGSFRPMPELLGLDALVPVAVSAGAEEKIT